jgi:galactitol-specific phosphotransferase system IIC component
MAFNLREHPLMFYVTFVLPAVLFILGAMFRANVFLIILCGVWLGVAFLVLYLPLETENEQF